MGEDKKDGGNDEFEFELDLDLDLDGFAGAMTKPGSASKNRKRRTTDSGGSQAPHSPEAPTVRPVDGEFSGFGVPRQSMIPGPGLDRDSATSSRPTNPGPGRAASRSDETQKLASELNEDGCAQRLGSLDRVPSVKIAEEEVFALGLDHRAGFLYSQIDGMTSFDDLLSISPMSRVETLRIFVKLLEHDAIELK